MCSPNSDIAYAALVCGSMLFLSKLSVQLGRITLVRRAAVIIAVINHSRVDTTRGGDLGGTGGIVPLKKLGGGDGSAFIPPPNI